MNLLSFAYPRKKWSCSFLYFCLENFEQVQEKKIKKITDMNVDPSKTAGNGCVASSSASNSSKPYLANGGYPDKLSKSLSNDLSLPAGGIPSLRLPVVVVPYRICRCIVGWLHVAVLHYPLMMGFPSVFCLGPT